ncbi:SDR family oxidoreductase [Streptomyces sp. DH37]|uniref:SDR family oxidoreductase n=1 Tax=Streptomyces sp. DH37 TaxID=3040122 RepID=UPI002441D396|nr:SDR family oxidoreductase [Streptomyces sp. DH37]MDG9702556.1 SDR family oxidoreductase [Streptomyces sp. DH37]
MTTLLTGATGFLGSRLLLGLLTTRGRHVTVLGRGAASELRFRVLTTLENLAGGGIGARARSRLRCVSGDVTRPWLGLAPAVYGRLAREAEAIWHCAGDIALTGERERLFRANVHGTERILELAESAPPDCRLVHMSTVAVAGGRRRGVVAEENLTDVFGFETHYDESKYRAETLVRDWARRLGRSVVVLRPSIVASDAAHREGMPGHPLRVLGDMIDAIARNGAPGIPPAVSRRRGGPELRLRLRVPADAEFNIVPDGYATEAMLRIGHDAATEDLGRGVRTFHVVHPEETAMRLIVEAVEARHPGLRLDCVGDLPDPTPAERFVVDHLPGFLSYCHHRRTYGRGSAAEWTSGLPDPAPVDRGYLARAMGFTGAAPTPGTG